MRKWANWAAFLVLLLESGTSRLEAGPMTPYQSVLLRASRDPVSPTDLRDHALLIVDMQSGVQTEIPIPVEVISGPDSLAVGSDDGIYVFKSVIRSLLARLDPKTSEWTRTSLDGEIEGVEDMAVKPDGNLLFAGEFGVDEIDVAAGTIRRSVVQRTRPFDADAGTLGVEIDSGGTIIAGAAILGIPDWSTPLFRQAPEAEVAERFDTGIFLSDFVLDTDGSVIGVVTRQPEIGALLDTGTLYRLNFDTKAVEALFESELLRGTNKIKLDPAGQIVAWTSTNGLSREHRIVRVDLEAGTAEVVADLGDGIMTDMDLRIIPEPSSVTLLVVGLVGFLALSVCYLRGQARTQRQAQ